MSTLCHSHDHRNWDRTLSWALYTASYSASVLAGEGLLSVESMYEVLSGKRYLSDEDAILFVWCVGLANWVGSAGIPLDWNRKWQKWPIPNSICGSVSLIAYHLLKSGLCWCHLRFDTKVTSKAKSN